MTPRRYRNVRLEARTRGPRRNRRHEYRCSCGDTDWLDFAQARDHLAEAHRLTGPFAVTKACGGSFRGVRREG